MSQRDAIRAEGLVKTLGGRIVLRGVSLSILEGECVLLRGDNGSGKTTLLRCLAGLVRPDSGSVRWFDRSPWETSARRLVGMTAHDTHLYPHLTLQENLVISGRLQDVSNPVERAIAWLESAGLLEHAHRLPKEVSQGMRRRASLARALIHEPPILLLDEPFSSLDLSGHDWLCQILRDRREQGRMTCLVSHEAIESTGIIDRVLELRSGRLRNWAEIETPTTNNVNDTLRPSLSGVVV